MDAELTAAAPPHSSPPSFYEAAQKIYPREVRGRFATKRRFTVALLLGLFYGVAWIS